MRKIKVLDQNTINKIAAGEVVDRPSSVVKELLENAIDAQATSITIEIKEGGISFIRITDNGQGIPKEDIRSAFLRHSTSKIDNADDLLTISSLGFRGEALSSIAAVSQVEMISKQPEDLTGARYIIEGGNEISFNEIGAPSGTSFIIRNLFYNVPARKKFLKSPQTEAGYIYTIIEKIALSNPNISIRFINNNTNRLFTSGNGDLKNIIYGIFGKDAAYQLYEINTKKDNVSISGYIGKPEFSRGNRDHETFFINGRYIKSTLISKSVEDAYRPYVMNHKYPFTVLNITMDGSLVDVNVHPSKMEIRIKNQEDFYDFLFRAVKEALQEKENIPQIREFHKPVINISTSNSEPFSFEKKDIEPFETKRIELIKETPSYNEFPVQQIEMFQDHFLDSKSVSRHRIIGEIFDTYWLVEFDEKLFIIDQHAAHEKVLYERVMKSLTDRTHTSQRLVIPMIVSLTMTEEDLLLKVMSQFQKIGYEIENFGGNEYVIRAIPDNLFSINTKELFLSILDNLAEDFKKNQVVENPFVLEKIASLSCKAAVKGNMKLTPMEVDRLINELLTLDNPYHCPHGRPTIISMSHQELSKKFKRIL